MTCELCGNNCDVTQRHDYETVIKPFVLKSDKLNDSVKEYAEKWIDFIWEDSHAWSRQDMDDYTQISNFINNIHLHNSQQTTWAKDPNSPYPIKNPDKQKCKIGECIHIREWENMLKTNNMGLDGCGCCENPYLICYTCHITKPYSRIGSNENGCTCGN